MWISTQSSATNHIICICQIIEEKWEYNEAVHYLYVDFKKYDLFRREVLYNIVIEFGIPMKLVRLIRMCLNETYKTVRLGKHFSDMLPIRYELKEGDDLSPLFFNFALVCAIRKVHVNQDGLKLNGTHQLLVYAADVNILRGSAHATKTNVENLVVASKETGLKVNADKNKYMVMSRDQDAGRSHRVKFDISSFERMEEFKYLATTLTNQNSIQEEI